MLALLGFVNGQRVALQVSSLESKPIFFIGPYASRVDTIRRRPALANCVKFFGTRPLARTLVTEDTLATEDHLTVSEPLSEHRHSPCFEGSDWI